MAVTLPSRTATRSTSEGRRMTSDVIPGDIRGCLVAVGDREPGRQRLRMQVVLLGAGGFQRVNGQDAAELDRPFQGQPPGNRGEKSGAESIARAGRLPRLASPPALD